MLAVYISSAVVATALLSMPSLVRGDTSSDINSVYICTTNIYADGFIYRNTTARDGIITTAFGGFPAKVSFPLHMAVTSHSDAPLDPIQPAEQLSTHEYRVFDERLYINASTDAFGPVGFTAGSNATLGPGETTWGFYSPYGFFVWYNMTAEADRAKSSSSPSLAAATLATPVHIQGFQWVPVDGYAGITQLYWNQTQYDLAAAKGSQSGLNAAAASFGLCSSDIGASVVAA